MPKVPIYYNQYQLLSILLILTFLAFFTFLIIGLSVFLAYSGANGISSLAKGKINVLLLLINNYSNY